MQVMEIDVDNLIDDVEKSCGVATMLEMAFHSKVTLFV
jgi:peroxiredoxin family protein